MIISLIYPLNDNISTPIINDIVPTTINKIKVSFILDLVSYGLKNNFLHLSLNDFNYIFKFIFES